MTTRTKPTSVEDPINVTIKTSDGHEVETTTEALGVLSVLGIMGSQIVKEMRDAVEDLSFQNWPHISRILDTAESAKMTVSFSMEIDRSGNVPKVTTKISYAEKHKDEREKYMMDPRQGKMDFEKDSIAS
jgi:hypothetical protein